MNREYDIRIVALDLDGTLLNEQKQISPRTRAAIHAAVARGVLVLPATGRPLDGLPGLFFEDPDFTYALTSNGALIADLRTRQPLLRRCIEPSLARRVADTLAHFSCVADIFADGHGYTSEQGHAAIVDFVAPNMVQYYRDSRRIVPDLPAFMDSVAGRVEKFSISFDREDERDRAWAALAAQEPMELCSSLYTPLADGRCLCNLEVNAPGVDKGAALLALAEQLGLSAANVMACGDSSNDLAMLQKAGLGVAMGNAGADIKAQADAVTDTNDRDGVALAIERYVL